MTPKPTAAPAIPIDEVLGTLRELMLSDESAPSRVAAAKILLERLAPKEDDEQRRRDAEESASAIAEARCLMADFALAKSAGLHEPPALAENRADSADHAAHDAG